MENVIYEHFIMLQRAYMIKITWQGLQWNYESSCSIPERVNIIFQHIKKYHMYLILGVDMVDGSTLSSQTSTMNIPVTKEFIAPWGTNLIITLLKVQIEDWSFAGLYEILPWWRLSADILRSTSMLTTVLSKKYMIVKRQKVTG